MMSEAGTVYLMYHELESQYRAVSNAEPGYARYAVRSSDFERQMQWLHDAGWRGVKVSDAIASAKARQVAITFDDGCVTDLLIAAPILKELTFAATFYVTVGHVGKPGYLDGSQVRDLCHLGFEIGCHAMTHTYLAGLPPDQLSDEIALAKIRLQQITGCRVDHFSCPGGRYDARVVQMARDAGYLSLATSRVRLNSPGDDAFALGRIAVMRETSLRAFQCLCQGKGLWKRRLLSLTGSASRKVLGDARYDQARAALLNR